MSALSDLMEEIEKEDGPWVEIDGDDFREQEREDGTRFHASVELRKTTVMGWESHYYAVLDTDGDWNDPEPMQDDDEQEDEDEDAMREQEEGA